MLSSSTFCSF